MILRNWVVMEMTLPLFLWMHGRRLRSRVVVSPDGGRFLPFLFFLFGFSFCRVVQSCTGYKESNSITRLENQNPNIVNTVIINLRIFNPKCKISMIQESRKTLNNNNGIELTVGHMNPFFRDL